MRSALVVGFLVACLGCGSGGGPTIVVVPLQEAPLVVAAGVTQLAPVPVDTVSAGINLARLGLGGVAEVYELTTPVGEAFVFDVLSRAEGNSGPVRVSIAHAADDGTTPSGGAGTIAEAGVVPSATGTINRGEWLDAHGDGFARITLRGMITREQVIAVETETDAGKRTALICVGIGPVSDINPPANGNGTYPGVLEEMTLYSSNSWNFGLPTIAVSGDRASFVVYEGDRADPHSPARYELRLQYDQATNKVTGGGAEETSPDTGHWRDHEIAALYNVLAVVQSGSDDVMVKLSFDRGASFAQTETLGRGTDGYSPRLCQIAMADDYTTAVTFWRASRNGTSELMLVEGRVSAFDATNSPIRFEFDAPRPIFAFAGDVSPVLMGMRFSEGGDLVIGYGFSAWESLPDGTWRSTTQFRCAVRLFGEALRDAIVEESVIVGRDPSVALVGSGDTMRIFFGYEGEDGVRLRNSTDAGRSWSAPETIGRRAAHMPTVFAQQRGGDLRVDVLYLAAGGEGTELHLRHWDDYGRTAPEDHRLTEAKIIETRGAGGGRPPGAFAGTIAPDYGYRVTQVAWFGYDAVRDGDEILVAIHEQTYDGAIFFDLPVFLGPPDREGGFLPTAADFAAALPPPLQEGMTGFVDPANPDDMNQFILMRLG